MKRSNYLIWFRRLVVLGAVVAGLTASSAAAIPMLDPQDSASATSHTTPLGIRADGLRWQAIARVYQLHGHAVPQYYGSRAPYAPTTRHTQPLPAYYGSTAPYMSTSQSLAAPGLRWQAIAKAHQENRQAPVPDVFERYAASHPYGAGLQPVQHRGLGDFRPVTPAVGVTQAVGTERIVDDSFRDSAPIVTPAGSERIVDDSFRDAPTVVASPTSSNGLDWADFGIGAGAMLGLTALVIGLGIGAVAMRHRTGRLGTS